jgi:hypothetical protein
MKQIANLSAWTLVLLVCLRPTRVLAQTDSSTSAAITSRQFTFIAQTALPATGTVRQLSGGDYDIKVADQKVDVYLPFFGRAYVAPINPAEGGFKFTTSDFTYTASPARRGGWNISIKPNDVKDVRELTLSISKSGYGLARIMSNSRQTMAFNGYIADKNK